ncbi:hypothetical protein HHI36_022129 [Cryptolaemus montrouzieri]|uniref:Uncharacterized protein n=1 Tax=Cryptolaemus montrouzieri TaxID=559131 RepID=A0ABD2MZM6_9CUCU
MFQLRIYFVLSIITVFASQNEANTLPAMFSSNPLIKEGQSSNIFANPIGDMNSVMALLKKPTLETNQNPFALSLSNPTTNLLDRNGLAKVAQEIATFNEKFLKYVQQVGAESVAKWNKLPDSEKIKLIVYGFLAIQSILTGNVPELAIVLLKCLPIIIDNDLLPQIPGVPPIPQKDLANLSATIKLLTPM